MKDVLASVGSVATTPINWNRSPSLAASTAPICEKRAGSRSRRCASSAAGAVNQIKAVAMRGRAEGFYVGGRAARGGDGLADRGGGFTPHRVHVALDMAGRGLCLSDAAARDRQRRRALVERDRFRYGRSVVDPQETGHENFSLTQRAALEPSAARFNSGLLRERERAGIFVGLFLGDQQAVEQLLLRRCAGLAGFQERIGLIDRFGREHGDGLRHGVLQLARLDRGHRNRAGRRNRRH